MPDAGPARRQAAPAEHGGQVRDAYAGHVARAVHLGVGDLPRLMNLLANQLSVIQITGLIMRQGQRFC